MGHHEDSACICRPIVLYFFLYNAVDEGPLRISRPAGQSVPSVAGSIMAIWGLEDRRMFGARTSNLLHRITIPLIICCLVTVVLCVHTAAALPGSGTQQDPWRIQSLADFDEFAADPNYWAGFTRLETDANLAGRTYSTAVIAPDVNNSNWYFDGTAFTGVFDGNNHKIMNLTIDDAGAGNDYLGLFGYIGEYGEVRNLGLEGGSISGDSYIGGLVGANNASISNCYSTASVSSDYEVGGLVGVNWFYGSVSNCYSTGSVSGGWAVGGLVGRNWSDSVSDCYSTSDVSGTGELVGGLVGLNLGHGSISNCYSSGDVNGDHNVGGLVGENWHGGISNCYSTGYVNGVSDIGGLVGYDYSGFYTICFWDIDVNPDVNGIGNTDDPNVIGKTTAEMQTKSTFTEAGWDFIEIWLINEGATYPVLRQEIRSDLNGDGGVDFADFAIFADHWLEGKDN